MEILKTRYADESNYELSKLFGRKHKQIYQKAATLGLKKSKQYMHNIRVRCWKQGLGKQLAIWTKEEIDFLLKNYSETPTKELVKKINRTCSAIEFKAKELHLRKSKDLKRSTFLIRLNKYWQRQKQEKNKKLQKIRELYPNKNAKEISKILGIQPQTIYSYARGLGLKKSVQFANGQIGEKLAENMFQKLGWSVIEKPSKNMPYDFLVDIAGVVHAIDVKNTHVFQVNRLFASAKHSALLFITEEGMYLARLERLFGDAGAKL